MAPKSPVGASPAASSEPGASAAPIPGPLIPGVTLTVEPSDGTVFGLPPAIPSGTSLLLFNVADMTYQMTVLEKNPSVTDSWDVILGCGVTSSVATVVGSVIAEPGAGSTGPVTVVNQGDDLLVLVPLAAQAQSTAPSEAPTAVPSPVTPAAASEAAGSLVPTLAPEPTPAPAATCPAGGIAGAASPAASVAPERASPSIGEASPPAAPSQAESSTRPQRTPRPSKSTKPTATPAPTPIAGIPGLADAVWQVFTVTPPGTVPGRTPAP